jgi:hypothetical protein
MVLTPIFLIDIVGIKLIVILPYRMLRAVLDGRIMYPSAPEKKQVKWGLWLQQQ